MTSTLVALQRTFHRGLAWAKDHRGGTLANPVLVATAAIVVIWLVIHVRWQTPLLLGILAAAVGALWLCRRRKDIVASALIAAATAALPGLVVILAASRNAVGLPDVAAVLTGHILAGPIPTLTAWSLRPAAISRTANSAVGSAILLAAAAPVALAGDHGFGPSVLVAGLTAAVGTVVLRHRRAIRRLLQDLPGITCVPGWTDLGPRLLPDGRRVHLMVGRGHALCAIATTAKTVGAGLPHRTVGAAIGTARALAIPARRVQPVVLAAQSGTHQIRSGSTSRGHADVPVVPSLADMAGLAAAAPRTLLPHRRVLAAAAVLARPDGHT